VWFLVRGRRTAIAEVLVKVTMTVEVFAGPVEVALSAPKWPP
jgi:hypothetical protein